MSDPNIPASEQAERENLSHLRPDVMRVVVGLVSNPMIIHWDDADPESLGEAVIVYPSNLGEIALDIVLSVNRACGVDDE